MLFYATVVAKTMKNTSKGVVGEAAMSFPYNNSGWWVGVGREAPHKVAAGHG